jgi:hypothetical protein
VGFVKRPLRSALTFDVRITPDYSTEYQGDLKTIP